MQFSQFTPPDQDTALAFYARLPKIEPLLRLRPDERFPTYITYLNRLALPANPSLLARGMDTFRDISETAIKKLVSLHGTSPLGSHQWNQLGDLVRIYAYWAQKSRYHFPECPVPPVLPAGIARTLLAHIADRLPAAVPQFILSYAHEEAVKRFVDVHGALMLCGNMGTGLAREDDVRKIFAYLNRIDISHPPLDHLEGSDLSACAIWAAVNDLTAPVGANLYRGNCLAVPFPGGGHTLFRGPETPSGKGAYFLNPFRETRHEGTIPLEDWLNEANRFMTMAPQKSISILTALDALFRDPKIPVYWPEADKAMTPDRETFAAYLDENSARLRQHLGSLSFLSQIHLPARYQAEDHDPNNKYLAANAASSQPGKHWPEGNPWRLFDGIKASQRAMEQKSFERYCALLFEKETGPDDTPDPAVSATPGATIMVAISESDLLAEKWEFLFRKEVWRDEDPVLPPPKGRKLGVQSIISGTLFRAMATGRRGPLKFQP